MTDSMFIVIILALVITGKYDKYIIGPLLVLSRLSDCGWTRYRTLSGRYGL